MKNFDVGQFIFYMIALIFSLSLHEAAHAWMSNRFGDGLARSQGRITLNPISHVDPLGTLIFPALSYFTGAALFGWARATPINPNAWRKPRIANFWVSIAGILANLLIAIVAGIIVRALWMSGAAADAGEGEYGASFAGAALNFAYLFFKLNIALAVLNFIPIPPLDGSKILRSFLPETASNALDSLDRYGFILLYIALFTGIIGAIFKFFVPIADRILFFSIA